MRIWPRYRLSSPVIATDTPGVDSPAASRIVERRLVGDPGALAALGYPLLQRIYAARGVCDMAELDYGLAGLPDYSDLAGIEVAVDVLAQAVADRRAIHVVGDFDADGDADLLALDATKHLIEFLRYNPADKKWESVMHFHVFDENMHYRGRKGGQKEPRELLVEDLNGDGKDDFALLVHDRLLTYLQE